MGITINVKIEDREVREMLAKVQARLKDLTPVMKIIGQTIRTSVIKNFEKGGRPMPWKPSARASIKGDKTLIDTTRLMRSITSKGYSDRAEVGTNVIYAAIHQLGGRTKPHIIKPRNAKALKIPGIGFRKSVKHPGSKIPARPFLLVQNEDWKEIKEELREFIFKK